MKAYGNLMEKLVFRIVTLIGFAVLLGVAIYGITNLKQEFSLEDFVHEDE